MCEEETDSGSTSQFVTAGFTIEFDGPLNSDKTFDYELTGDAGDVEFGIPDKAIYAFDADGPVEGVVLIGDPEYDNATNTYSGKLLVREGVENLVLGAKWEKKSGDLTGQESVTLTFSEGNGQEDGVITTDTKTVVLDKDGDGNFEENCPPEPPVQIVLEASAACENEATEALTDASFSFVVSAEKEGETVEGVYEYVLTASGGLLANDYSSSGFRVLKLNGDQLGYTYEPDGDGVVNGVGTGKLFVHEKVEAFKIVFDVNAQGSQLLGNETVGLALQRLDNLGSHLGEKKEDSASLSDEELGCDPNPGDPVGIDLSASAACENEATEQLTDASFSFVVSTKAKGVTIEGAYTYGLTTSGGLLANDYSSSGYRVVKLDGSALDHTVEPDGDGVVNGVGTGKLFVHEKVEAFKIVFDVNAQGSQLLGNETVELGLQKFNSLTGESETGVLSANASLSDEDLGCDPNPGDPVGIDLSASAACENEATEQLTDASFSFVVSTKAKGVTIEGAYTYGLTASGGLLANDYSSSGYRVVKLDGSALDHTVEPDGDGVVNGVGTGKLFVHEKVEAFKIVFDVNAQGSQLLGNETVELGLQKFNSLTGESETGVLSANASLSDEELGCDPNPGDPVGIDLSASAACENEATEQLTDASFSFVVSTKAKGVTIEGAYTYGLTTSGGLLANDYSSSGYRVVKLDGSALDHTVEPDGDGVVNGVGTGKLFVHEKVEAFKIVFDVNAQGSQLLGNETVELGLQKFNSLTGESETGVLSANASLSDEDLGCDPNPGDPVGIDLSASAACENEATEQLTDASFSFVVSTKAKGVTIEGAYTYGLTTSGGLLANDYSSSGYRVVKLDGSALDHTVEPDGDGVVNGVGTGKLFVHEKVEAFKIVFDVNAQGSQLLGNETVELGLQKFNSLTGESETGVLSANASLSDEDLGCDPNPGDPVGIDLSASAACENEATEQLTDASFSFVVSTKAKGVTIEGAYTYGLTTSGGLLANDYSSSGYRVVKLDGSALDHTVEPDGDGVVNGVGTGKLFVHEKVEAFKIVFDVNAQGSQLLGNETVELGLQKFNSLTGESETGVLSANASLSDEDLGCDPNPGDPVGIDLSASAACENEATEQLTDASFSFVVSTKAKGVTIEGAYTYGLTASGGLLANDYSSSGYRVVKLDGSALDHTVEPDGDGVVNGVGTGKLFVHEKVEAFKIVFDVNAQGSQLLGNETVELGLQKFNSLTGESETGVLSANASLSDEDLGCDPNPGDPVGIDLSASAACENEATEQLTDASFSFVVSTKAKGVTIEGAYTYGLTTSGGLLANDYSSSGYRVVKLDGSALDHTVEPDGDGVVNGVGTGKLFVHEKVEAFKIVFDVNAQGSQLLGNETVELGLQKFNSLTGESETGVLSANASLSDEDLGCDPNPGDPVGIDLSASAACENEATEQLTDASFSFVVSAEKAGESVEGAYTYGLTTSGGLLANDYSESQWDVVKVDGSALDYTVERNGDGTGKLFVNEKVEAFKIVFDVNAQGSQLLGNETVGLELQKFNSLTGESETGVLSANASLADEDLGCDPNPGDPVGIDLSAFAACENEETEQLTDASFSFVVSAEKAGESVEGAYTYGLTTSGGLLANDYSSSSYRVVKVDGSALDYTVEGNGDGTGKLSVNEKVEAFKIVFDVNARGSQLLGNETVGLELQKFNSLTGESETGVLSANASLADEDLGCDPNPGDPLEIDLDAEAACVVDGALSDNTAEFTFTVDFDPSPITESIDLDYVIEPSSGLIDEDYAFNLQLSDGVSIKEGGAEGVLEVDEGVSDFTITITASAADSLKGDEEITLTLNDGTEVHQETASLAELDCAPEPGEKDKTDVQLYLLMDNSTSMLQPDPSTTGANRRDRLESQDRVSLYAYQVALEKAGYGFSRKGESGVLSTPEFKVAVINNSAADLSNLLNDFEVVVNPDSEGAAEDLTVHLITYGYAVDYGSVQITAADPSAGTRAAQAIVGVKTPDQIYGNSIEGNSLWVDRNLPTPTSNDTFRGEGRPASNLYSGTEMMGALEGLEHLLTAQAESGGSDPITTYISMTTDGRPERRAWWDTRKGPGSDSLTGQEVRLPEALGGDAITTSGLNYDSNGNHRFLLNNEGSQEWEQMQGRLNDTLNAIAAQAESAETQLQVSVVGMGDGTDADFPAIYADLFGERTFDPSQSDWDYKYFTSYALPDFVG